MDRKFFDSDGLPHGSAESNPLGGWDFYNADQQFIGRSIENALGGQTYSNSNAQVTGYTSGGIDVPTVSSVGGSAGGSHRSGSHGRGLPRSNMPSIAEREGAARRAGGPPIRPETPEESRAATINVVIGIVVMLYLYGIARLAIATNVSPIIWGVVSLAIPISIIWSWFTSSWKPATFTILGSAIAVFLGWISMVTAPPLTLANARTELMPLDHYADSEPYHVQAVSSCFKRGADVNCVGTTGSVKLVIVRYDGWQNWISVTVPICGVDQIFALLGADADTIGSAKFILFNTADKTAEVFAKHPPTSLLKVNCNK